MSEDKKDDEDLLDLWDWIDSQPWADEDMQGGLTEEERKWCREWCRGNK